MAISAGPVADVLWDSAHNGVVAGVITVPAGTNRILLVSSADVEAGGDATLTGISSDLDGAFTRVGNNVNNGIQNASLWRLLNPTVGEHTLTPAYGDSATEKPNSLIAHAWTGVDQTTPFGTPATATGTSTTAVSVTATTAAGEVVIDTVSSNTGGHTTGADQTQIRFNPATSGSTTVRGSASYQDGADGGVMTTTLGAAGTWAALAVSMKPAAEAPGAVHPHLGPPPHLANRHFSNLHLG